MLPVHLISALPSDLLGGALSIFKKYGPLFWSGTKTTLLVALTGTVIGLIIGLGVGILRSLPDSKLDNRFKRYFYKLIKILCGIYVEVFRGTPMIVQAMFLYFALKPVFHWTKLIAGIFVVSINTGAYMAEIMRGGIQSLDKGQNEAARSIGMSYFQTMRHIVLPQAIRNAFPAIGNEFVVNIKDTSVLNVIGVTELFFQSTSVAGITYRWPDVMLVTALIYLVLTFTTTSILRVIERKMNMPVSSGPSSSSTTLLLHNPDRKKV
jgi:putative lysine transport system permease protein